MGSDSHLTAPNEMMLELVQLPNGEVALRPADGDGEPLVTIRFSEQIQKTFGEQLQGISQSMVQAALMMIAEQQMAHWQAQVLDEKPAHYS
jgi:polyhydroxyalkanoate synthesis regulator protein